jgi:UDPglucose 6-dehydrogenase
MEENIAIIGHLGMVGSTVFNWFKKEGYNVMGLSLSGQTHTWEEINSQADYVFVCVPTPYLWKEKTTSLAPLREVLLKIKAGKVVIHKCTVPPGTTQILQKEFPSLKLIYNPEFLSEKTAEVDFANPDRQLVGYTSQSYDIAIKVLNLLPISAYGAIITSTEAELCKFVNNFHGALMVIFSNFFYDVSQKFPEVDYEKVKKASQASKWVGSPMGRMYWEVFHGGFRGYGGHCFPKDVNMLLEWCKNVNMPSEILEATKRANERILENQGLTEEEVEKRSSRIEGV